MPVQLGWQAGDEGNLLLAEPLGTSKLDRELMTQLMFEQFNVSGLFMSDQVGPLLLGVWDCRSRPFDESMFRSPCLSNLLQRRLPVRSGEAGAVCSRHLQS